MIGMSFKRRIAILAVCLLGLIASADLFPTTAHAANEAYDGMVAAHNSARRHYGVPALSWSNELAGTAQSWANHLKSSRNCQMQHSGGKGYGENLAWGSNMHLKSADVVRMWVDEAKDFNERSNTCRSGKVCGHFTQVVWKKSTKVGCAAAHCGRDEVWVCQYSPPGNWNGERPY